MYYVIGYSLVFGISLMYYNQILEGNSVQWNGIDYFINMHVLCIYFELLFFLSLALLQGYPKVIMMHFGPTIVPYKYGKLRGRLVEFPQSSRGSLKHNVEAYFGIQYASVRNSQLRYVFSNSPTSTWRGLRNAIKEMPVCPQKVVREKALRQQNVPDGTVVMRTRKANSTVEQIEDCLYVNLYVPLIPVTGTEWNEREKFPVMIFVHGESYKEGTGNAYDGSVLASYGGVIVITVNYRLGVLGFFSTGDKVAEGNYALWDLLAILFWVNENIAPFGGDPDRVTLFGHGHGAALVNLLLFTKTFKQKGHLFNNAIIQSGSAFSSWATSINPARCAYLLAQAVDCSNHAGNSEDLVKCLRNKTIDELVHNVPLAPKYYTCFAPVIGGGLFSGKSIQQMIDSRDTMFASTKIMFGLTRKEAYSYLKQREIQDGISEYRKKQYLRTYVNNVFKCHKQKIYDILDLQYTHWDEQQTDKTRRDDVMDLISDGQYKAPLVKMALEHAKTADTYFYSFAYSTLSEEYPQWSGGVHGDELPYIFGAPLVDGLSPFPSKYTPQEKELSKHMMNMWTNFAKTGDPNRPVSNNMPSNKDCSTKDDSPLTRWPKYNASTQSYLHITKKCMKRKNFYRSNELALWLNLIPKFNRRGDNGEEIVSDLEESENTSTYDDPGRLLNNFYTFPPSPMPPLPPQDWPAPVTTESPMPSTPEEKTTPKQKPKATTETKKPVVDPVSTNSEEDDDDSSAVPLSITVAVGCALIFLNLLICAGMYYQRERIKKLREAPPRGSTNDMNDTRNNDRNKPRDTTPPEGMNLVHSQLDSTLPKVANLNHKPHMDHVPPVYSAIAKPIATPQGHGGYSYSALSQTSSPMHSHNQIHFAAQNPRSGPPSEDGSLASSTKGHNSSARPPGSDRSPKSDPRLKHITRGGQQVTSNNAITIV